VNRRQALETLRAGPALVTGFPGDAVDIGGLLAHLIARRFEGGVYIADLEMESLVWVQDGAPQDAWFFDSDGGEAVLVGDSGHELFREMASNGAMLSVYVGGPPEAAFGPSAGPPSAAPATVFAVPAHAVFTAPLAEPPPKVAQEVPAPVASPEPAARPEPEPAPMIEPSSRPWPLILEGVGERVARHRGQRLAARFTSTLAGALAPHGGRIVSARIITPPMTESTWRAIVEEACAPIVAVAGRAFVDRVIAAAERDAMGGASRGADP
jgi:hypothetical protein